MSQYLAHSIECIIETGFPLFLVFFEYLATEEHQRFHNVKPIPHLHIDTEFS